MSRERKPSCVLLALLSGAGLAVVLAIICAAMVMTRTHVAAHHDPSLYRQCVTSIRDEHAVGFATPTPQCWRLPYNERKAAILEGLTPREETVIT